MVTCLPRAVCRVVLALALGVVSPWELGEAILAGAESGVVVRLGFCPADTRRRLEMHVRE